MNAFEYALGLFSVLIALALGDIAFNAHKLLRHCRTVVWDGRVLIATLLVIVVIVRMWFALWTIRDEALVLVFGFYLSLFVEMMILFMLAATVLPDEPAEGCDLASFYEANQRILWSLFALFQLTFFLHWLYFGGLDAPLRQWLFILGTLLAYLLLAWLRGKKLHYGLPLALLAIELARNWDRTLSGPAG